MTTSTPDRGAKHGLFEALVERARFGDEAAFEDLTRLAGNRSLSLAQAILGDAHAAERAVRRAYVAAWRGIPRLREPRRFELWLNSLLVLACAEEVLGSRRSRAWRWLGRPGPTHDHGVPDVEDRDPVRLSDPTLAEIGRRVASTSQVSVGPLARFLGPLRAALICAGMVAIVMAAGTLLDAEHRSGPGDAPGAALPAAVVPALARPTPKDAVKGLYAEGALVRVPEFGEPLSFIVPRLPESGEALVLERFERHSIALRSGTSFIAIHDDVTVPVDLCRDLGSVDDVPTPGVAFDSWVRGSRGVDVLAHGLFAIGTGTIRWFDIRTDSACRYSFLGPSERHRLLLVPAPDDLLLVITGGDARAADSLDHAAIELAASMRFECPEPGRRFVNHGGHRAVCG